MVWGVFIMAAPSGELWGLKVTPTHSQVRPWAVPLWGIAGTQTVIFLVEEHRGLVTVE